MAGEDPEKATGGKGEYLSLDWYEKVWIAFAGPLANYILAAFMFSAIFTSWGASQPSNLPQIGELIENQPAIAAGLLSGDTILTIDGNKLSVWGDISENLKDKADKTAVFEIERDGKVLKMEILVGKNPVTGSGIIGIAPKTETEKVGFFRSIEYGIRAVYNQSIMTVVYLVDKIVSLEKPDIAGPVGIMKVMADAAKNGLRSYITLVAVISVALGLFNLFPIPFVDGGMIVLFLIEAVTRRRAPLKLITVYNTIGIIIICGIFVFATYSDLIRLGAGRLFGG
jgi:regulator of sigma E protease